MWEMYDDSEDSFCETDGEFHNCYTYVYLHHTTLLLT